MSRQIKSMARGRGGGDDHLLVKGTEAFLEDYPLQFAFVSSLLLSVEASIVWRPH